VVVREERLFIVLVVILFIVIQLTREGTGEVTTPQVVTQEKQWVEILGEVCFLLHRETPETLEVMEVQVLLATPETPGLVLVVCVKLLLEATQVAQAMVVQVVQVVQVVEVVHPVTDHYLPVIYFLIQRFLVLGVQGGLQVVVLGKLEQPHVRAVHLGLAAVAREPLILEPREVPPRIIVQ